MKNNTQRSKHKEAFNRKRDASNKMLGIGIGLDDPSRSLGIVLEHTGPSQISFYVLKEVSELCKNYIGLDISLFYQHLIRCELARLCPMFHIKDLLAWKHPVVATNVETCLEALRSKSDRIYHYVFGVDFIDRSDIDMNKIRRCFIDPRVTVITRSIEYKNIIEEEFEITIDFPIVENFSLKPMCKQIFGDTHATNKV